MTDSGPTTAGSIVGKLRMDRDLWVAEMAKTKQDVAELSRMSPTIRLDMDVSSALSKIEAVRAAYSTLGGGTLGPSLSGPSAGTVARVDAVAAAERRLAAATSAADSAFARAELAQMRLNELRDKGTATASRMMAAEIAATEAVKRLDAANERATLSEAALSAAQEKAAAAAVKKAAAEDAAARETVKANEANKTSVSRMGLITGAVALLLPLLGPVAAGAVGIGAAFLGMGAAGVFALVGINREMKQGTELGKAYTDGVTSMKGVLGQLSATAALNMLASFRRVVAETNDDLPFLNQQVGTFSGLLGRAGAAGVSGFLTSLRVMNPLLLTSGVYLERLALGFERWTKDGGLQTFSSYALSVLPKVTDLLGALATMVLHILEALAPLGAIGIAVLTGIADTINAIPVDVLGTLLGMVTWGAIAFKAWGFIAPMLSGIATSMGAVGAATTIATGPIGWIVAAAGALAAILAVVVTQQGSATAAMRDYTAAVQADTGAIGENVRQKVAQKLLDDGVYDLAKKLKVSTEDVTNATLGDAAAKKRVNEQLEKFNGQGQITSNIVKGLTDTMKAQADGVKGAVDQYATLQDALGKTTDATAYQKAALEAAAAAAGVSVAAYQSVDQSQDDMAFSTEKATAQMYLQNDAAGLLRQTLDLLNGKTLGAEQAQNQFDSQIANMADHTNAAGKEIDRANTLLEGNTAAAVKNRGELIALTQAAENSAQAFRDNGGSAEDTKAKLEAMKQQIIENAIAHGEDADQVQAYLDKIFKIPESIPPTKLEVDTAAAERQLDLFIANVNTRVATIQVRSTMPDLNGSASGNGRMGTGAMGTTARGMAGGGSVYGPGTAGSDTAGVYRLAHGEEVVSNVFGQADRNRAKLKQINAGVVPSTPSAPSSSRSDAGLMALLREVLARIGTGGNVIVNPSEGMSETTIGRVAADAMNSKLRAV